MELRAYWQILKRRSLLVLIPALVVLAVGVATYSPPGRVYNVGVRFIVGQAPSTQAATSDEERLANWQTSEYIVNGLTDWVRGGQFAALVSQRLADRGTDIPAGAIQGSIAADNTRSMMTLSMTFSDAAALEPMIGAAAEVLITENDRGLPQLGGEPAELVQLDQPIVNPIAPGIADQLQLPLRLGLALAAGLGLAFLVEYLDPTVRDRAELESLELPVLGVIPKE
jgi:capsular polysaccharide biosynthesis protein